MVLVLCGAGRTGRGVENIHLLAKTSWQHRKRTAGRSPSGGGAGTAEVIDRSLLQAT